MVTLSAAAAAFAERLRAKSPDDLERFVEAEIHSPVPFIFDSAAANAHFQDYVAAAIGIGEAASNVLVVGSAQTGFSLDPDRPFEPFRATSDIDVVVVDSGLFDAAWDAMLAWDYLTIKARGKHEQRWLWDRQGEVWSGWCDPPRWYLRERGGVELSFPAALKPLRDFSYRWFTAFQSLSRYRQSPEIARHRVSARLYRTRSHAAMYHAVALRTIRAKLLAADAASE